MPDTAEDRRCTRCLVLTPNSIREKTTVGRKTIYLPQIFDNVAINPHALFTSLKPLLEGSGRLIRSGGPSDPFPSVLNALLVRAWCLSAPPSLNWTGKGHQVPESVTRLGAPTAGSFSLPLSPSCCSHVHRRVVLVEPPLLLAHAGPLLLELIQELAPGPSDGSAQGETHGWKWAPVGQKKITTIC